jgi:L-asparaginase
MQPNNRGLRRPPSKSAVMKIALLVTGGTFDKEYNELTGALYFKKTHLPEMLALGRCRLSLRIEVVMLKDSLQMTIADRRRILLACQRAAESRIVITHGTDTMEQTARFLGPEISGQTVILTGAMVPYRFGSSDGMFNLGCSIGLAQALPPGVYVVMNGRYFLWSHVTKNRQRGYFHEVRRAKNQARGERARGEWGAR